MKKVIVLLGVLLCLVSSVFATEVETTWLGTGKISQTVTADDDAGISFESDGGYIEGNLVINDMNDNPYNYGVDTVETYATSIVGGGYSTMQIDRLTSIGSYGNPGQGLYSYVFADGGFAEMATGAKSNYASMKTSTYGKSKTTNGKNFEADATNSFILHQEIWDGDNDGAFFHSTGSGTMRIDAMSHEMSGSSFKFAKGAGSFTNADIDGTGTGNFRVYAVGDNGLNVDTGTIVIPGDGSDNSANYDLNIGYSGHLTYGNFALSGN